MTIKEYFSINLGLLIILFALLSTKKKEVTNNEQRKPFNIMSETLFSFFK